MSMISMGASERIIRHAHLFCGIGAGAKGFNLAKPRIRGLKGRYVCNGGIDVDAGAIRSFDRLTGAKGTVLDLFAREQYVAFHGRQPPEGWHEATTVDIRRALDGPNGERPDVIFLSAPCKGFSGLLSAKQSTTDKYQALNALTLRGVWLTCEAYKDGPIPVILFENVPRILTRGRYLLDQISAILRSYGYNVNEDVHDCGELAGLAQSRKRMLLIARQTDAVPVCIYQPKKLKLKGVGERIGLLPLPGDPVGGPMHRVPALQWKTWVRLAFVPAGKDWRALNELAVENGMLRDFGIVPELRRNALGVVGWADSAPLLTGQRGPLQGRFSVADPRPVAANQSYQQYGVSTWDGSINAVTGQSQAGGGVYSVADPRPGYGPGTHQNILHVAAFDRSTKSVLGAGHVAGGALSVADPRPQRGLTYQGDYLGVRDWGDSSGVISSRGGPTNGAYSVADPRPVYGPNTHSGVLGVIDWSTNSYTLGGSPNPTAGANAVADPRVDGHARSVMFGVRAWDATAACVKGDVSVGTGPYAVADVRLEGRPRFNNTYRIVRFDDASGAVAGPGGPAGGACVADPRPPEKAYEQRKYKVTPYDGSSRAVIGASSTGDGAFAVADPRGTIVADGEGRSRAYGKYRVEMWIGPSRAVIAGRDNGAFAVADPRCTWGAGRHESVLRVTDYGDHVGTVPGAVHSVTGGQPCVADPRPAPVGPAPAALPEPEERLVCRIVSTDETWHRPFTTLELATLQSILDPAECFYQDEAGVWQARGTPFDLESTSDATKREWIGNAVPSESAKKIAEVIGEALLLADAGETFQLSEHEIWVSPLRFALAVDTDQDALRMDRGLM